MRYSKKKEGEKDAKDSKKPADCCNIFTPLLGRYVETILRDDGSKPEQVIALYQTLVEEADLLFTPYGSWLTGMVLPIVEQAGIPCIAHTAADRRLWDTPRRWCVQMINPADTFLDGAALLAHNAGLQRVALVYRRSGFPEIVMEGVQKKAATLGLEVVGIEEYTDETEREKAVKKLQALRPDWVAGGGFQPGQPGGGFLPDAVALTRTVRQYSLQAPLYTWLVGPAFPEYWTALGSAAEYMTGNTGWKPLLNTPGNQAFIQRYQARWGIEPDAHAANAYGAGQLFAEAVQRAGSIAPAGVRDALFALKTTTVFGRYAVNTAGLQVGKVNAILQWQGGKREVVWPAWLQTAKLRFPDSP